jgi:hypothetical protein
MSDINKKAKVEIGNTLKKSVMQIGDVCVPVLTKTTKTIIIECNDGHVAEINTINKIK